MTFSLSTDQNTEAFDPNHDMDLIAAINEARTPEDLDRISTMARHRFAARARQQRPARRGNSRPGLRSTFSLRPSGR